MSERDLIVSNLDSCWTSIVNLFEQLDSSQWQTQSLCPDWTVKEVAAHLVSVEQVLSNWMPDDAATPPPFEKVGTCFATAMQMTESELVTHMEQTFDQRRRNLADASQDDFNRPSVTPVGQATYGRFMAVREFDAWMHERDCRSPLGMPTDNGGAPAEMALNEVRLSIGYIAGKKIANPIGQIWSGAMMLEHLGHQAAAADIVTAIENVLVGGGPKTPDIGGQAGTSDLGDAIVGAL